MSAEKEKIARDLYREFLVALADDNGRRLVELVSDPLARVMLRLGIGEASLSQNQTRYTDEYLACRKNWRGF